MSFAPEYVTHVLNENFEDAKEISSLVSEISQHLCGRPLTCTDAALTTILSPRHFPTVRRTLARPAPDVTAQASHASRWHLDDDRV